MSSRSLSEIPTIPRKIKPKVPTVAELGLTTDREAEQERDLEPVNDEKKKGMKPIEWETTLRAGGSPKKNGLEGKELPPKKPKVPTLADLGLTQTSEACISSLIPPSNSPLLPPNIVRQ